MQYKTCLTCRIVFAQRSNERDKNYAMREVCSSKCLAERSVIVRRCITCSAPFTRHVNESASSFNKRNYCALQCAQQTRQPRLWFNLHGVALSRQELADMFTITHTTAQKRFPASTAIARCVERPTLTTSSRHAMVPTPPRTAVVNTEKTMIKKKIAKLSLKTESLRLLTITEMGRVAGASTDVPASCSGCASQGGGCQPPPTL